MRRATGLGKNWQLVWMGARTLDAVQHPCQPYGPGRPYEPVNLKYRPTGRRGVEVAKCDQCCIAWVRSADR